MEKTSYIYKGVAFLLILIFASLCFLSQKRQSVTVDEFSHFPSGVYNLATLDWRMDWRSPPLVKCWPAMPAFFTKPAVSMAPIAQTPNTWQSPNTWQFGYDFMYRNYDRYVKLFSWARIAIILLSCAGGWILFVFAKKMVGEKGALLALFLYAFNPNILAHSQLATIDMGATAMFTLAVFAFWQFLGRMNAKTACVAGVALGLAQLSKFTCLMLYPIFFLFFIVQALADQIGAKTAPKQKTVMESLSPVFNFLFLLIVSVIVINIGYLFSKTFFYLNDHAFSSDLLKKLARSPLAFFPIPLPFDYVGGFDIQLDISSGKSPFYMGYLMGEHSMDGWRHYYLVGMLVKNPEIMTVLIAFSLYAWIKGTPKPELRSWLCVWGTIVIFTGYFSFFTNTPIGIRFMLPIFPLLFIAIGQTFNLAPVRKRIAQILTTATALLYLLPAIANYPNHLSYFNALAGGPQNGHQWLIDSNLDWGQDLPALKQYMDENKIDKVKLGCFGRVDPRIYGIDYSLADRNISEGVHVISVNFLVGRPYYLLDPETAQLKLIGFDYYKNYRYLKQKAIIGNTLYVFEKHNL